MTEPIITPDRPGSRDNLVLPFRTEASSARGRAVRLGTSVDQVLSAHDYPAPVARLLGEAVALAAMLGTMMKDDGIMTLQIKGDGPVSMLVADCRTGGGVRGYAQWDRERDYGKLSGLVLCGKGHLAITMDPAKASERYQGITELTGARLADTIRTYFDRSEQLPSEIVLEAGRAGSTWRAGGVMVQRMPAEGGAGKAFEGSREDWSRIAQLLATVKREELLDAQLTLEDLLYRLFHEEGVRVFDPRPVQRACTCTEDRLRQVLASLPADDRAALAEEDTVEMACEFCNRTFRFDSAGLAGADQAGP